VPKAKIGLKCERHPDGLHLYWHLDGKLKMDSWAVCRSSVRSQPAYPPLAGDKAWVLKFHGDDGSFVDGGVDERLTYYYRVAALDRGSAVIYSDTVKFVEPGAE
jgi:hypothetical protein